MELVNILTLDDFLKISPLFSFGISQVNVEMVNRDGEGNWRGGTSLWSPNSLKLDIADIPIGLDGKLVLTNPRALETFLHELYHLEQYRRGFLYKIKIMWWNLTIKYGEDLPVSPRPHEAEARLWAQSKVLSLV